MSEELKPCPFCKGEFAFDFEAKNFRCGTCGATVLPDPYARTVNTRPIEDALKKRIAELEGFIDRLIEAGNELEAGLDEYWEELSTREVANWRRLVKEWKEREE